MLVSHENLASILIWALDWLSADNSCGFTPIKSPLLDVIAAGMLAITVSFVQVLMSRLRTMFQRVLALSSHGKHLVPCQSLMRISLLFYGFEMLFRKVQSGFNCVRWKMSTCWWHAFECLVGHCSESTVCDPNWMPKSLFVTLLCSVKTKNSIYTNRQYFQHYANGVV